MKVGCENFVVNHLLVLVVRNILRLEGKKMLSLPHPSAIFSQIKLLIRLSYKLVPSNT